MEWCQFAGWLPVRVAAAMGVDAETLLAEYPTGWDRLPDESGIGEPPKAEGRLYSVLKAINRIEKTDGGDATTKAMIADRLGLTAEDASEILFVAKSYGFAEQVPPSLVWTVTADGYRFIAPVDGS